MTDASEMRPTDEKAGRQISDDEEAPVGAPTKFPVLFAVIAGLGLVVLASMLVEFVAR